MSSPVLPKATFFKVKDNSSKIQLICSKAHEAYRQEKKLLITVPNFQAAEYIEKLLWQQPENSFMPHVVTDTSTAEWIAITMQEENNVNRAVKLLNLNPTVPKFYTQFQEIYELYDETHPQKIELSLQRLQYYESKGILITNLASLSEK